MQASPRLVTPEAVVLQFETAGLGSRLLAALLDLVIQGTVLVLAGLALMAFVGASGASGVVGTVLLLLLFTVVLLGYPIAFEALGRGRTPGKAALGLRVVTRDGAPIMFRHAVVRGFLGLVDFYLTSGAAAVIAILVSADNQRLGDLAAGTIVLRERSGAGRATSVRFFPPYGYEGYVATLDVGGLTPDEYGAVRSFLLRAASLPPDVRVSLAAQVASTVASRMHHAPPHGVGPELFLACVAAASQRRPDAFGAGPVVSRAWEPAVAAWSGGPAAPAAPVPPPSPADAGALGGFSPPG